MKKTEDLTASSLPQLLNLTGFIVTVLSEILSANRIQYWLAHKTELRKKIFELFSIPVDIYTDIKKDWEKFYKKTMEITVDFSTVIIPDMPQDGKKYRLLFIAVGITCNQVYSAWKFSKSKSYNDIDKEVIHNVRTSATSYAIWVLDSDEPDQDTLGKSTQQADPASCEDINNSIGMTLLEREVYEMKYYDETGKTLDVKGLTFCSGSRDAYGYVPCVYKFNDGRVFVDWGSVDNSNSGCGIRRVVS